MTVAKDQHFLPQFYLRYFVDPDTLPEQEPYVWIFELSERRWRRRAPKNVASSCYYYAYRDENDQLVNIIEPQLSSVESLGAALIRKLESHETLTEQEQLHFSFFVALLTVRTPQNRDNTRLFVKHTGRDIITDLVQWWREHPEEFDASKRYYQEQTGTTLNMNIVTLNRRMVQHAEEFIISTKPTFLGDEVLRR